MERPIIFDGLRRNNNDSGVAGRLLHNKVTAVAPHCRNCGRVAAQSKPESGHRWLSGFIVGFFSPLDGPLVFDSQFLNATWHKSCAHVQKPVIPDKNDLNRLLH